MFYETAVLKNLAIFTGKTPVLESLSWRLKLEAFSSAALLKRDSIAGISCGYCKIFKNTYFEEYLRTTAYDIGKIFEKYLKKSLFFKTLLKMNFVTFLPQIFCQTCNLYF